jgi:hypothetical protein
MPAVGFEANDKILGAAQQLAVERGADPINAEAFDLGGERAERLGGSRAAIRDSSSSRRRARSATTASRSPEVPVAAAASVGGRAEPGLPASRGVRSGIAAAKSPSQRRIGSAVFGSADSAVR